MSLKERIDEAQALVRDLKIETDTLNARLASVEARLVAAS